MTSIGGWGGENGSTFEKAESAEQSPNCSSGATDVSVPLTDIRDMQKAVKTIFGYGHFNAGQDGFQALSMLRKFFDVLASEEIPYGYCPHCGDLGVSRERTPKGNDTCASGHIYPSSAARQ